MVVFVVEAAEAAKAFSVVDVLAMVRMVEDLVAADHHVVGFLKNRPLKV